MDDEGIKAEEEYLEVKEWEESNSDDTFEIWKVKKYIDERITQLIIGFIVGIIVFGFIIKNF